MIRLEHRVLRSRTHTHVYTKGSIHGIGSQIQNVYKMVGNNVWSAKSCSQNFISTPYFHFRVTTNKQKLKGPTICISSKNTN